MSGWQIVFGFLGTLVIAVGGWVTAKNTSRSSPYDALAARVVALEESDRRKAECIARLQAAGREQEQRISDLEEEHGILRDALLIQHEWQQNGATPPPPTIHPKALALLKARRDKEQP